MVWCRLHKIFFWHKVPACAQGNVLEKYYVPSGTRPTIKESAIDVIVGLTFKYYETIYYDHFTSYGLLGV